MTRISRSAGLYSRLTERGEPGKCGMQADAVGGRRSLHGYQHVLPTAGHASQITHHDRHPGYGGRLSPAFSPPAMTCGFRVELRGFEPLTPSMRTNGTAVKDGRCGRPVVGGNLTRPRSVADVAVLLCCTATGVELQLRRAFGGLRDLSLLRSSSLGSVRKLLSLLTVAGMLWHGSGTGIRRQFAGGPERSTATVRSALRGRSAVMES
jgi:hypothetical protein